MPDGQEGSGDTHGLSKFALIAVSIILILGLGVPILTMIFPEQLHPSPAIVALLLGLGLATVVYYLLGGVSGAAFDTPMVKLGGSAAVLIATAWIAHGWLAKEQTDARSRSPVVDPARVSALDTEIKRLNTLMALRDATIRDQKTLLTQLPADTVKSVYARVAAAAPKSPLGLQVRSLAAARKGPFDTFDDQPIAVRITFHHKVEQADHPIFTACDQLGLGGKRVRFSIAAQDDSDSEPVTAQYAGTLPFSQCEGSESDRIQLSCTSARTLIPAIATGCSPAGQVEWVAGNDRRYFAATAEVYVDDIDR